MAKKQRKTIEEIRQDIKETESKLLEENFQFEKLDFFSESEKDCFFQCTFLERIRSRNSFPYDVAKVLHEEMVKEEERDIEEVQKDIGLHDEFLKQKRAEYEAACDELKRAKRKKEQAHKNLIAAESVHGKYILRKERKDNILNAMKEELNEMLLTLIVHPSANFERVAISQMAKIIVTEYDADIFQALIPDKIVKECEMENLIISIPFGIKEKYEHNQKTLKSIIAFCNLVANVRMEEENQENIKVIYSNKDIAEILRFNGLEV